jgi:hypothetical protein
MRCRVAPVVSAANRECHLFARRVTFLSCADTAWAPDQMSPLCRSFDFIGQAEYPERVEPPR